MLQQSLTRRDSATKQTILVGNCGAADVSEEKANTRIAVFDHLPDSAYVRLSQLVRSPKKPETLAPLPFSAPTLWRKVKEGTFPKPVKLSERITGWNVGDVRAWMAAQASI